MIVHYYYHPAVMFVKRDETREPYIVAEVVRISNYNVFLHCDILPEGVTL